MFKKNLPHCLVHVVLNFSIKALMSQSLLLSNFALQLYFKRFSMSLTFKQKNIFIQNYPKVTDGCIIIMILCDNLRPKE